MKRDISKNICEAGNFDSAIFLKAICDCTDDRHTQTLEIEADEDGPITLTIFTNSFSNYISSNWIRDWKNRLSLILSILTKGYCETSSEFIISGTDQIDDYLKAISDARNAIWSRQQKGK
jgi:hypothetical protein